MKNDLTSTLEIFGVLSEYAAAKPFVPVRNVFTDGFKTTDLVLPVSEFKRFMRDECDLKVYNAQRSWQAKATLDDPKKFFVRMDDRAAVITPKLLRKIARSMNKYRAYLRDKLTQ